MICRGLCFCAVCGEGGGSIPLVLKGPLARGKCGGQQSGWCIVRRAEGPGDGRLGAGAGKEGALTAYSPPLPLPLSLGLHSPAAGAVGWGSGERGAVGGWEPRERLCSRAEQQRAVLQGKHLLAEASKHMRLCGDYAEIC